MQFNRLLPEPGTLELEELREAMVFSPGEAHRDRPYTIANFVSSADGRAALEGRSAPLSGAGDRAMFHALRERVDAITAGTGTLRTERYGRLIPDRETQERRQSGGFASEPIACVITHSGDLPTDIPLFSERAARVVVFTATAIELDGTEVVELDPGEFTLLTVMRRLRAEYGVRSLLCEGGPTLFGSLLREGLIDELFLTLSPKLAGGGRAPTITSGQGLAEPAELRLQWALESEGSLLLRYSVSAQPSEAQWS